MKNKQTLQPLEVEIQSLGGMGDGVAEHQGKRLFVPYTCVGDIVLITPTQPKAKLLEVLVPSSDRSEADCQHFGRCGGCSLQHLTPSFYTEFKSKTLRDILQHLDVDASVMQSIITVGEQSRRRVELKVRATKDEAKIGFFEARSHALVDVMNCPVMVPEILTILPALREVVSQLSKPAQVQSVQVTKLDHGLDMSFQVKQPLNAKDRTLLTNFAQAHQVLRLSEDFEGEAVFFDSGDACVTFGLVEVALPVGAFLQASKQGEEAILSFVLEHLKGCERVIDLYSGCGTYSFPLLQQAEQVMAVEGSQVMVSAMQKAVVKHQLEDRMSMEVRDLYRAPLKARELQPYDGLAINPPRNGALPQVQQIAKAKVPKVVMVSCNPRSFQRDAKALLEAGYEMINIMPIDQFYWSSHLEVVACFEKT